MAPKSAACQPRRLMTVSRRGALAAIASVGLLPLFVIPARASTSVSFGLNPLFLDSDINLLAMLRKYLARQLERPIELVKRRTYQEITAMLLSGQLDAAWVCDGPYVQHESQLALLAVPLYHHEPRYQAYVIVNESNRASEFDDIRGTVHAFSDPDSNSGFLVTRYLLALRRTTPAEFFQSFFFTYGHRNVVRAVAAGLAQSGSVDGYVWDVMREREPELINKTRVVYRSERLGFPPIVGLQATRDLSLADGISRAFIDMPAVPLGRDILAILQLDGFTRAGPELYQGTLDKWLVVKAQV